MARHGGAKLATRIAMTVSKAHVATQKSLVGIRYKLAMMVFHGISDVISGEVHETIGQTFKDMHEQLPEDSPARPLLAFMAYQTGQLQALSGTAIAASGLFSSIATIMNNELAPIVNNAIASNPHLIPDPGTIAQMAARGIIGNGEGIGAIGQNGFPSGWAQDLIDLNKQYPSMADAFDMVRRGIIGTDTAVEWATLNGIPQDVATRWLGLIGVPISPADAALALLRGNIDAGTAQSYAAAWGVNANDFAVLVDNTGEPLGLEQLLEAYRRGFIDQATLQKGILESRVRNEWIPTALQLAYSPMSVSDAVNAVVQNQLAQTTAETYAQENGLMPGQFQILLNTAGEPLSRTEMEDLYNRGEVTEAQVTQALSESRLKNKYSELAFKLHTRLLPPSTLADAVLYGAIDQDTAVQKSMMLGYNQDDATTIVLSASNEKLYSYRVKIVESITNLYEVNAIDETTATGYITDLGFSAQEAAIILQSAEYDRTKRLQSAAINMIRNKYVGRHLDVGDAQQYLQAAGVPVGEIAQLLQIWGIELNSNVRKLTPAQVVKAYTLQLMDEEDATDYLLALGYSAQDASLLLQGV